MRIRFIFSWRRFIVGFCFPLSLIIFFYLLVGVIYSYGWRLNFSRSMPLGIYRIQSINGNLQRGDLVVFCLPKSLLPKRIDFLQNGQCLSGGAPFLKSIIGIPGDRIETGPSGVRVNGVLIEGSACRKGADLMCNQFNGVLSISDYWVFGYGSNPMMATHSFDSRYFGVIPLSSISGIAK